MYVGDPVSARLSGSLLVSWGDHAPCTQEYLAYVFNEVVMFRTSLGALTGCKERSI
jgi:hypothetical protein